MSNKIPTWEEMESSGKYDDYGSMARAYTKLHVRAALEAAADNAKIVSEKYAAMFKEYYHIESDSILNAYPEENIK